MKIILIFLIAIFGAKTIKAEMLDISRMDIKSRAEIEQNLKSESDQLIYNIESGNWRDIYRLLSSEARSVISEDKFVYFCSSKHDPFSIQFKDKVFCLDEKTTGMTILAQCIYTEKFSDVTLYRAITWRLDPSNGNRKWQILNLSFENFHSLPMELRFRF